MSNDEKEGAIGWFIVGFILAAFIFGFMTHGCTEYTVQNEAIRAGVAEWTIDPKTGVKTFKYKKP